MAVETVETLCLRARESIERREWDKAKQLYLQALGVKPDSPDVHHGLGTVAFQLRDYPGACYHFKEVTRLDPLRAIAYINLGAVYNLMDQLDEAIPVLRRGIQIDTHRSEGYYNLGLVYRRKKQTDLAIHAYSEAIRINPRMSDAHYNLGNLFLEKEQYGRAVAHYQEALALRPNWEKAVNGLAQAEAGLAALNQPAAAKAATAPSPDDTHTGTEADGAPLSFDPERMVDPHIHGALLTSLHKATIESESQGRQFLQILESQIEPAIKELSSCLLYPNSSISELDSCVQKFEQALQSMNGVKKGLQSSIERVRNIGDKLLRS